ncbi:hypothetical protein [Brevundimonas sp.]|uniref:hypothetical protein n=1 Tax=Brevundimonas sp. TaxID=1871086 RepID=UPI002D6466AB|nr:hypothetical protein [Brevundimonas sp.]HYC67648.1 hypothetical protein [Brevundimonas sp.]
MKIDLIALALVAAAFTAAFTAMNWLLSTYAPGASPAGLFLDADIIAKLVMLLLMLLTLPVPVIGLIGLLAREAARPMVMVLRMAAAASVLLGLLAAAYGWINIQAALRGVGPVGIEVTAPSWAELLLVLAYSLLVAGFALLFAVGVGLRAGGRRKA